MVSIDVFTVFLILVGSLLLGSPLALVAWIRPIRRWALSSRGARLGLVLMLATISFSTSYSATGRLRAEASYYFGFASILRVMDAEYFYGDLMEDYQRNKIAIVNELWLQHLFLPFARGRCWTGVEKTCYYAADLWSRSMFEAGEPVLPILSIGLGSGVVTAFWVGLITRKRRKTLDSKGGSTLAVQ